LLSAPSISQLIFVAGFARSGTTWVSNVINAHPDVLYRHEFFGRRYALLGDELFRKVKFDSGLSDDDYASALRVLARGDVDTDKPPFFPKRFRTIGRPTIQKLAWLAAKTSPAFAAAYARLFTPGHGRDVTVVVKETGAAIWLESYMAGMRANALVVVIRHPYAVIASHLVGSQAGLLQRPSAGYRESWFKHHATRTRYLENCGIASAQVAGMSDVEFLALSWRVQNDEYLRLNDAHPRSKVLIYEGFVADPRRQTEDLLRFLALSPDEQVFGFLDASTSTSGKARMHMKLGSASSKYYSVFREKDFDRDKWNRTLSPNDLALIDRHTAPLVSTLGLAQWVSMPTKAYASEAATHE